MQPLFMKALCGLSLAASLFFSANQAQAGYETCYEQEYRCETRYEQECRNDRQCYTIPGQQECHQEQVCSPRPYQPSCQTVTECGTNAQGQQICKDRQVCNGGGGGGQDCHYVQQCRPGYSHQECRDNYQCHQVPRQDCRYETVAKQCWKPDPPPFHPPTPPPQPPEPPYYPPQPPPQPPEPPYDPPQPPPQPPVPPTNPDIPAHLGERTVTGLKLRILVDETAQVVFKDVGQSTQYETEYRISVENEAGEEVIHQVVRANGLQNQKITLDDRLSLYEDHTLILKVVRKRGNLPKQYSFEKTFFRPGAN